MYTVQCAMCPSRLKLNFTYLPLKTVSRLNWCHKGRRKTVEFNLFQIFINMIEFYKKLDPPAPLPLPYNA